MAQRTSSVVFVAKASHISFTTRSYTFINGNASTTYNRHHQTVRSLDVGHHVANAFQHSNRQGSHCTTSKGVLLQSTQYIVEDDKGLYGLHTSAKHWQEHLSAKSTEAWFHKTRE
eukprot:5145560-Amphidinium_carterae.3